MIVLDRHLSEHLARALVVHAELLRRRGRRMPAPLAELLRALHEDMSRPTPDRRGQRPAPPAERSEAGGGQLVSQARVAELLGVSTRTVRRLGAAGRLTPIHIGRRTLYRLDDLQEVTNAHPVPEGGRARS